MKKNDQRTSGEAEKVAAYMNQLDHPFKDEIEMLRTIIKNSKKQITERIKWNAPSYFFKPDELAQTDKPFAQDFVTFNPRAIKHIHLVFHHPEIVNVNSALLEGDYSDRRMMYFTNMSDLKLKKGELERIIKELIQFITKK